MDNNIHFDFSDYGVFNGVPTVSTMNRKERRKYIKSHKNDKNATICKWCNSRTLKISDDNGDYFCELCGKKEG